MKLVCNVSEREIDALVYRLYDLMAEEIVIVEQGLSKGGGIP